MARIVWDDLECCDDCQSYIANGDTTATDKTPAEYQAMIEKHWPESKGLCFSVTCDGECNEFSWRECDICGAKAGRRHSVIAMEG